MVSERLKDTTGALKHRPRGLLALGPTYRKYALIFLLPYLPRHKDKPAKDVCTPGLYLRGLLLLTV